MYDTDTISNIIDEAKKLVIKKRKKYDNLMKVIEYFIAENDIIVKETSEYFFDLYTLDMFNLPLKLTNLLYETDPNIAKYVTLEVKIYKYHSRISIEGIQFVHFTYINSEIRQNILGYTCKGIHTKTVYKCFGPEVLLINLYADLINPLLSKNWSSLYTIEDNMSQEIISHLTERVMNGNKSESESKSEYGNEYSSIFGGVSKYISKHASKCVYDKNGLIDQMMDMYFGTLMSVHRSRQQSRQRSRQDSLHDNLQDSSLHDNLQSRQRVNSQTNSFATIDSIKHIILTNYICDQHVLVGQIAINIYNDINYLGRIQIVTSKTFDDEIKVLKGLLGTSIFYSINNLKIPTNLNLHKMTIFYEKDAIIDIYNAGNFELINYNKLEYKIAGLPSGLNVGSPFVIMRFRLVDIWSTLYNIKAGNLSKNTAMPIVHRIIGDYVKIRNKVRSLDISEIFSLNYIGYFEDQNLNKMRLVAKLKDRYIQPYMPLTMKK